MTHAGEATINVTPDTTRLEAVARIIAHHLTELADDLAILRAEGNEPAVTPLNTAFPQMQCALLRPHPGHDWGYSTEGGETVGIRAHCPGLPQRA